MAPGYFDGAVPSAESSTDLGFSILVQRVNLTVDFASQSITGTTDITVQPLTKELKHIRLNCRQARITEARIEGKPAAVTHVDPYEKLKVRGRTTVHQHQNLRNKIEPFIKFSPDPELSLTIPARVHIQELQADSATSRIGIERQDSEYGGQGAETPQTAHAQEIGARFAPLKVFVEFKVDNFRDGLHFAGFQDSDPGQPKSFPHLYTMNSIAPGSISSVFPCVDNLNTRCMWEISIRCPKTLGDAFRKPTLPDADRALPDGDTAMTGVDQVDSQPDEYLLDLNEEDRTLDLNVIASADLTDDIIDPQDPTMRTVSFTQAIPVCARHIGFAIGPFEHVDLSEFREIDQDDKLGQNAIHVHGYCLPTRAEVLRNTCMPMAKAIDDFTVNYGSFPFTNYKLIFVDELLQDISHTASLSICNNRLLFPEDIIDPLDPNTRILIHALASQYVGVNIIPKEATDMWTITGISGFMCDMFMKKLAGNNEYRFRQKLASEKVFELDYERYSIFQLGSVLDIDPSEYDFLALKSALVLYILDRRLAKASGSAGMSRIIARLLLNEKTGDLENGEISTDFFQKLCEKLGHQKLDAFFRQWVLGAGCPIFHVNQRFNKKKLVVEMMITQKQMDRKIKPKLETTNFMREIKEQVSEAWAPGIQPVFTGPMTIRIHEADGTPYEHIVEIKEAITKIEIPYNTKYKRLKRSKRAKERALASTGSMENTGDGENDVLLYCLGDVLQSEDEVKDWNLTDWGKEEEDRMGQESYEWIRMDADFEWIGKIEVVMPVYMYVSQLQQDRDVVAQYESLQYVARQHPHPLMSTILIRTLMDRRYFHGIRTLAAAGLARCAVEGLGWIGLYHLEKAFNEFFCIPDSPMPRANDFSDRTTYIIQCSIPKAISRIRDNRGRAPMNVRRFFVDKLKFNDNSNNEFQDCFYVATLMNCLADVLVASAARPDKVHTVDGYEDDDLLEELREDQLFAKEAAGELERYRRIDEWIASYQNVYSVTAMNCMQKLQQAGVIRDQFRQIMQYTQAKNSDDVRLKAFTCLVDLGEFKSSGKKSKELMQYLLHSICDDDSPFFRDRLTRIFGQALGSVAIKDEVIKKPSPQVIETGLVLDQEAPVEVQLNEGESMSPAELALVALKSALQDDAVFKQSLWQVIQSPALAIAEVVSFLDIAALLYEPATGLMVHMHYPRYQKFSRWEKRDVLAPQKSLILVTKATSRVRSKPHNGLGLEAWELLQQYGLKWTGELSKAVKDQQRDLKAQEREQKAQIAALQTQLQRQQSSSQIPKSATSATKAMSPPPLPTPTTERPGPKISLKRKQSTTSETSGRAGSPKRQQFSPPVTDAPPQTAAPKPSVQKSSLPKPSVSKPAAPKAQRSPSVSKTKAPNPTSAIARPPKAKTAASTVTAPAPATPASKTKSLMVRLKIARFDRVLSIQAKKERPNLKVTTELTMAKKNGLSASATGNKATPPTSTSILPSKPTGGNDFFSSPAVQSAAATNSNFGGFRFFGGSNTASARAKAEHSEPASAISPMTNWAPGHKKFGGSAGSGSGGGSGGSAGGGISRATTPKITMSRAGTPLSGVSRAGTPKPLGSSALGGGSRAGTPIPGNNSAGVKRSIPPTSGGGNVSSAGSGSGSTSAIGNGDGNGEPERKKLKLKLGRKPTGA